MINSNLSINYKYIHSCSHFTYQLCGKLQLRLLRDLTYYRANPTFCILILPALPSNEFLAFEDIASLGEDGSSHCCSLFSESETLLSSNDNIDISEVTNEKHCTSSYTIEINTFQLVPVGAVEAAKPNRLLFTRTSAGAKDLL